MMSMTSDVIDIDELNTGKRREGIFGAIYWWMVKFGLAIAGLLSGLILTIIDFNSGAPTQTYETMFNLRLFFSAIPLIGTLIAIWVMIDYDISEERTQEIRAAINQKKAALTDSSGYVQGKLLSITNGLDLIKNTGLNFSGKSTAEIKSLFSQSLNKGLHGLCFSPYTEGQGVGDTLSESQIRRRMEIVASHTKWVRSFSCTQGNELIPKVAREKDLKTMVGAWISQDKERNESAMQG